MAPSKLPNPGTTHASAAASSPAVKEPGAGPSGAVYPQGIYPPEVLAEGRGTSAGAGTAVLFAAIAIVLLVLMVTGYNNRIPYLHPSTGSDGVSVIGDRDSFSYLYVENGTYQNVTAANLCPQCPFPVSDGGQFSYALTMVNTIGNSSGYDVETVSVLAPFHLDAFSLSQRFVPFGLSETVQLTVSAPDSAGTYTIPIELTFDVEPKS